MSRTASPRPVGCWRWRPADPSHAYLLYGPRGSGKDDAAHAFIAAVLGTDEHRVDTEQHPDLYVVEPEGEAILIDQIRELRGDLHLRPFEAPRRAYLIREAETMGRDAANALLKSLEEPPEYAVFVLVCHDRARLLPTIDSRCQHIRFRTPSAAAIAEALGGGEEAERIARLSRGDLDVARRLHARHGRPAAVRAGVRPGPRRRRRRPLRRRRRRGRGDGRRPRGRRHRRGAGGGGDRPRRSSGSAAAASRRASATA